MPELDEAWGAKVAQEIELDLGRAFAEADSVINTPKGKAMLRRYGRVDGCVRLGGLSNC